MVQIDKKEVEMKFANPFKGEGTTKLYNLAKKISQHIAEYFENYIKILEQKYQTELEWRMIVKLDNEDINKLQQLGFDKLLEKLKDYNIRVRITDVKGKEIRAFRIACIEKDFAYESSFDLVEVIAFDFVCRNQSPEMLDARCHFWIDIIQKIFEQENEYAKEVENRFLQTKIYKEIMVLKKF